MPYSLLHDSHMVLYNEKDSVWISVMSHMTWTWTQRLRTCKTATLCNSCVFPRRREQKDPVYLRDKVSQKHSKEQFESAQRVEQDYSKYFTGLRRSRMHLQCVTTVCWCVMVCVLMQVWCRPAVCPARALRSWPSWSRSRTRSCGFLTEAREKRQINTLPSPQQ